MNEYFSVPSELANLGLANDIAMTNPGSPLTEYIYTLLDQGKARDEIHAHLLERGHEEEYIKSLIHETLQTRFAARRSQGINLICLGAGVCLLSCLLTLAGGFSLGAVPYVLYGLTTGGIVIGFIGFTRIF